MPRALASIVAALLMSTTSASSVWSDDEFGDRCRRGACRAAPPTAAAPATAGRPAFPDRDIREWHFHVYFFQNQKDSVAAALRIKEELVAHVDSGDFVVVLDGVDGKILPQLSASSVARVPSVNMSPVGPHPAGSFEVWAPAESLASALSFFMRRRGELSILLHPLGPHEVEDHHARSMWLGDPWKIDLTGLPEEQEAVGSQYPELGLGYAAQAT